MDQAPGSPQGPEDQGPPHAQSVPGCYRHPDRETGIRCTRCDRPICPECMVNASVGFQCPECARGDSGTGHPPAASRPRTLAGGSVTADPRLLTKILIGINIAVFIAVHVRSSLLDHLVLIGEWPPAPFNATQGVAEGEWYRLVTSMFTHQEIWHIGFNMLSLWWLGGPLEAALGRARYLSLYFVSAWPAAPWPICWPHRPRPRSVPPARSSACSGPPRSSCAGSTTTCGRSSRCW